MNESRESTPYSRCQLLSFEFGMKGGLKLEHFLELTRALDIPALRHSQPLFAKSDIQRHFLNDQPSPPRESRSIVLICGAFLEEEVSFATHQLLAIGFDVCLVRDLIQAREPHFAYVHDHRMFHSGALLVTSRQIAYEWSVTEVNTDTRGAVLEFLAMGGSIGAPR